jgi:acyl phosphate:glycerol-3-phosphate acyltransferase
MNLVLPVLIAYLVGAIPNGLLLARLKGVDIRKVGSGNIGATNVLRAVGKPWGIATFALDALKGYLPAALLPGLFAPGGQDPSFLSPVLCGVAAILGHNFPVYLKFKGGKGVATSAGVLLAIAPAAVGVGLAAWLLLFFATRYVAVASIGAAVVIPVAGWFLYARRGALVPAVLTLLGLLVVARHASNIRRLLDGTEHRFTKESKKP